MECNPFVVLGAFALILASLIGGRLLSINLWGRKLAAMINAGEITDLRMEWAQFYASDDWMSVEKLEITGPDFSFSRDGESTGQVPWFIRRMRKSVWGFSADYIDSVIRKSQDYFDAKKTVESSARDLRPVGSSVWGDLRLSAKT